MISNVSLYVNPQDYISTLALSESLIFTAIQELIGFNSLMFSSLIALFIEKSIASIMQLVFTAFVD